MRARSPVLTEAELEIMKVVWDRGEATVRDVYDTLRESRKIAYTTVMTMMGILEQKGHLTRHTAERAHMYRPAQEKGQVLGSMVREFLNRVFDGSAKPLLQHLVDEDKLSASELEEIAGLLKKGKGAQ